MGSIPLHPQCRKECKECKELCLGRGRPRKELPLPRKELAPDWGFGPFLIIATLYSGRPNSLRQSPNSLRCFVPGEPQLFTLFTLFTAPAGKDFEHKWVIGIGINLAQWVTSRHRDCSTVSS